MIEKEGEAFWKQIRHLGLFLIFMVTLQLKKGSYKWTFQLTAVLLQTQKAPELINLDVYRKKVHKNQKL